MKAGSHAAKACKSRQTWKGAAVSKYFWVLWGYLAGAGC